MSAVATSSSSSIASTLLGNRSLRMVVVLLLMWLALAVHPDPEVRGAFLTPGNFSNLTAQVAEIVIIGVGMTMVILIGGIDLSVGAGMALTGVVAAKLQIDHNYGVLAACGAAVAVSAVVGLWHGLLVTRFQIPPFVATLSGFLAYRGLGLVLSDARGLSPLHDDFLVLGSLLPRGVSFGLCGAAFAVGALLVLSRERRRKQFGLPTTSTAIVALQIATMGAAAAAAGVVYQGGMPVPVLLAGVSAAIGGVLLRKTRLGRYAFAIGGNAEAARLSGVPVVRTTILIYLLTGVLVALAGLVAAARTNGVTPGNAGLMRELHVITAVVIGGTSLQGGRATMLGTVLGALVFGTLSNGMNLMNVNSNWQLILTGAILLGASMLDAATARRKNV